MTETVLCFVFIKLQKSVVKSPSRFNRVRLFSFSSPSDFQVSKSSTISEFSSLLQFLLFFSLIFSFFKSSTWRFQVYRYSLHSLIDSSQHSINRVGGISTHASLTLTGLFAKKVLRDECKWWLHFATKMFKSVLIRFRFISVLSARQINLEWPEFLTKFVSYYHMNTLKWQKSWDSGWD